MKPFLYFAAIPLALTLTTLAEPLETGFLNPPDSAKPQTWWHWMNGNITRAGITADLEAMKEIGLGGATIVNVDSGIPRGDVPFMSPAWREDFKFAMQEANRLGLDMTVENCAGWSSSGGPWNTPEHAMQRVTTSELHVTGPATLDVVLPQPPTKLEFYRDIAVLAFPAGLDEGVRMRDFSPTVSASDTSKPAQNLTDGNLKTFVILPSPRPDRPQYVELHFQEPYPARTVSINGAPGISGLSGEIQVSDDGQIYRKVVPFAFPRRGTGNCTVSLGTQPVSARFWRLEFESIVRGAHFALAEIELTPRLTIDHIDAKAGFIGTEVLSSRTADDSSDQAIPLSKVVDLTSRLQPDGRLDWQVPAGKWVILRFGHTPIGIENHPAPKEGTGLECDKMSKRALDLHWDGFMQKILDDIGPLAGKTLTGSLIDSYEVGGQNWTRDFSAEFKKRRGYDLTTYLPAFTGRVVDSPAVSERFLWDVRRTIADLFAENYFGRFAELCHERGLLNATEPYGGPFESLQSGAPADVVMGEFWVNRGEHPSIKLAASIAHIYGKTIVAAESFTAQPDHGRWQNHPYALKALGDLKFCQGLNRYVFHRYAMQPWTNRWPGMTMGQWGFHFDRTQTWWHQGKAWIDYISRCEFLLQQGRAVADAAYFTGESAPLFVRACDPELPEGYDYDAVNADVLLNGATVKNGRLTLASGANYAVLILPPSDINMTPKMLQRIADLVRAGATVVGPRPEHSPSLADYPDCDAQVKKLADELWGDCDGKQVKEHAYGAGRVVWGQPLAEIFAEQKLPPDFGFTGASTESKLACGHRVDGQADIYFVSNQRPEADTVEGTFRVSGKVPELWHPDTGVIERAPVWQERDGRTTVRLTFDPAGSVFVIFREAATDDHVVSAKVAPQWQTVANAQGGWMVKATTDGTAEFQTAAGKTLQAKAVNVPAPEEVAGAWTLNFPPHWGAPPSVTLDKLISWPEHPDQGVRYFSGTASYEKEIEISAGRLSAGRELWLDLGEVKHFAEVSLNGHDFGVLWKPPFRVNITPAAKPGANHLVVKVTNLWPNRLIGDEQLPPDCEWNGMRLKAWPQWLLDGKPSPTGRLTFSTWHHWTKNMKPLASGLLGPVTLQTAEVLPVR